MIVPEDIINNLIPKIAKEQNFDKYESKVKSISSGGANYATTIHTIKLSEKDNVVHMFAKVSIMGEMMRKQASNIYETEIYVYTKLFKLYERLQEEHQVPIEYRLSVPKFYGCHDTFLEETIVLEDLVIEGYQAFNRFNSVDWEYTKSALSELAKMHSLAFAFSVYHPEEFDTVLKEREIKSEAYTNLSGYFKTCLKQAIDVAEADTKNKLERYFKDFETVQFIEYQKNTRKPVLGHGDFRPSNLMHRMKEVGTFDIKIVDFQTLHGSSPVVDLLYFIFTGSDEQFRAKFYDKSVEYYYSELEAAMMRLHLNPEEVYSRTDFEDEMKEKLAFGLATAVIALPIITVPAEKAHQVTDETSFDDLTVVNTNAIYAERMNGVVNDYVKWGVLK